MARLVARGDIWMYRFARPGKQRPVLVLSRPVALQHLYTAIVAPITGTIRGLPSELRVGVEDGLRKESVANFDHLITVPQAELRKWVGRLDADRMKQACAAADIALGCR